MLERRRYLLLLGSFVLMVLGIRVRRMLMVATDTITNISAKEQHYPSMEVLNQEDDDEPSEDAVNIHKVSIAKKPRK